MEHTHDLPDGMVEWIAETGGGKITALHRHVARREAWVVDVTRPDGSVLKGFLRLERTPAGPKSSTSLTRETRIIQALAQTDIPVPEVYGVSQELNCTLFERVRGRSDIDKLDDPAQQRAVMEDFIRVIARLHTLDLSDLITYGVRWLRKNAPSTIARLSLVQGDTGPVNFMFDGNEVSAIIDLEWGHYGDPLEDLGNICAREFWNPSGGLTGLFHLYQEVSGIPYTKFAAHYYRVQQNVRGMIPIHAISVNAHPRESLAWFLCYRYLGDRATCESLSEAAGITVKKPPMPDELFGPGEKDVFADAAIWSLEKDVAPHLSDAFAQSRAGDAAILIKMMDRKRRFGAQLDAIECDELEPLLGSRPVSRQEGMDALNERILSNEIDDTAVIAYLTRRAYRDEWLHDPAVSLYPTRTWSKLDD